MRLLKIIESILTKINYMSKSDKPLALKTIGICLSIIAIVYILLAAFTDQVAGNFKNGVYTTGVIILSILFIAASIWAYFEADSATNDNKSRAVVIVITAVFFLWICGWVAGSNEKVAPGSPQLQAMDTERVFEDQQEYALNANTPPKSKR